MKLLAAANDVNVVSVAEAVHVPEKCVTMSGDDDVTRRTRLCSLREMRWTQQQGMTGCAFEDDVFQLNSGNGDFREGIRSGVLTPASQQDFLLGVHPDVSPDNVSAEHGPNQDQNVCNNLPAVAER